MSQDYGPTARLFANYGARVGINSRAAGSEVEARVRELGAAGSEVAFFQADLTSSAVCAQLVAEFTRHFGGLDVLINNAGDWAVAKI